MYVLQASHAGRRLFRCETCGEKFECCCLMQVHSMRHSQPLTCPQCGDQHPSRRTYNEHVDEHMGLVPVRRAVDLGYLLRHLHLHLLQLRARYGQHDKGPAAATAVQPGASTASEAERCAPPAQSSSRAPLSDVSSTLLLAYLPVPSAVRTRSIPGLQPGDPGEDEATRDEVRSEKDVETEQNKNDTMNGVEKGGKRAILIPNPFVLVDCVQCSVGLGVVEL